MKLGDPVRSSRDRSQSAAARKLAAATALAAVLAFVITTSLDLAETFFNGPWLTAISCVIPAMATLACVGKALRSRRDRLSWALIAAGFGFWSLGAIARFTMFDDPGNRPVPSWVDPLFLAMYPLVFAGMVTLIRNRLRNYRHVPWYDGIAGALALAAVSFAFLYGEVDNLTGSDRLGSLVLLAYPVGDFALLVAVSFALRFNGRRLDGPWPLVGAGLLLFISADIAFALTAPEDSYLGIALYGVWYLGLILVAMGAWRQDTDIRELKLKSGQVIVPMVFLMSALVVLIAGQGRDLEPVAIACAVGVVIVVALRLLVSAREASRTLDTAPGQVVDDLTGLASEQQVDRWLSAIPPQRDDGSAAPNARLAVMTIGIDRFQTVNLALGLRAGGDILSAVGTRLNRSVGHLGRLGRVGTEAFILILERPPEDDVIDAVTTEIRTALEPPLWIEGLRVYLRPIVGIALFPEHASAGGDLLRLATAATQHVKDRDQEVAVYSGESDTTRETLELLADLKAGIDRGELELHYQPKVHPADRSVDTVEALVRWRHPRRGLLGPYQFLDLAERNGLMHQLTERIVSLAIDQMARWRDEGVDLSVAVNLAMPNLLDTALPERIADRLDERGLDRGRLTLEVTENVLMSDPDRVLGNLNALKAAGMKLSLDDFGAGTTSLAYLRDLPLDEVKMDRSMVAPLGGSGDDAVIVSASISIARDLGLHVVAEGAEDAETVDELVRLGCDEIQGYHFAKPMPPVELTRWLAAFPTAG